MITFLNSTNTPTQVLNKNFHQICLIALTKNFEALFSCIENTLQRFGFISVLHIYTYQIILYFQTKSQVVSQKHMWKCAQTMTNLIYFVKFSKKGCEKMRNLIEIKMLILNEISHPLRQISREEIYKNEKHKNMKHHLI